MRMMKLLCGLAGLPLIAGVAFAETPKQADHGKGLAKQPTQLNDQQMDKVSAGWDIRVLEVYNTGWDAFSSYEKGGVSGSPIFTGPGNTITCGGCYLLINNAALSVASYIYGGPIH